MDELPLVNDDNYAEYLAAPASVVVFSMMPCENCEAYDPIVRRAAAALNPRVRFGKAKVHVPGATREIKRRYRFDSFPTTHFYKTGTLVHSVDHRLEYDQLVAEIEKRLLA
ncbi:MAG: thioredoxin family protein [Nitrospirota bacterium]